MTIQANREFRDPVHGLIRLTDQEVRIIDQMPFQRLRRIKQLAMAHLVYPGALHTRFDHSLGTLHSAGRILDKVAKSAQMSDNDIAQCGLRRFCMILGMAHSVMYPSICLKNITSCHDNPLALERKYMNGSLWT